MFRFFSRADNIQELSGSPAYLENIHKLFVQDQSGGLVEVASDQGDHLIYLYLNGRQIAVYQINEGDVREVGQTNAITAIPASGEANFRYLQLPPQAVRAVWQALSWSPPVREARLSASQLADYLDGLRSEMFRGLVYCRTADWDGFLLVEDGVIVGAETTLASTNGFQDSLPGLRGSLANLRGECALWLIEPHSDTLAAQMLDLRMAMIEWNSGFINTYRGMVGTNLITPLTYAANSWFRQRQYNAHLVSSVLIDHNMTLSMDEVVNLYSDLLSFLLGEMTKVIGEQLAQRCLHQSHTHLKPKYQKILQSYPLLLQGVRV